MYTILPLADGSLMTTVKGLTTISRFRTTTLATWELIYYFPLPMHKEIIFWGKIARLSHSHPMANTLLSGSFNVPGGTGEGDRQTLSLKTVYASHVSGLPCIQAFTAPLRMSHVSGLFL
jgi:hypothetical protein